MCAAVVERVQPAVQPWKPKSRQRPSCQDSPDSSSTKALESAPDSPVTDQSIVESPSAGLTPAKHPLQNRWSMWYFKNDKAKEWKDNHKLIASCDTIEDFWALYNFLKPPSNLQPGCDYSFFKEGIEPMWEDPRNVEGGRWLLNLQRQQRSCGELDKYWQEALMCLIGEIIEPNSDEICGAVVNIRPKGDKLAIWTGNAEKKHQVMTIGKNMRVNLAIPRQVQIEFQAHKDTSCKNGSTTKKRYVV